MWTRTLLPLLVLCLKVTTAFTMASEAAASVVSKFASKPFIQRALKNPSSPESVLSFFFGVDYSNQNEVESLIKQGGCFDSMPKLWYGGGPEYDKLCQPFLDVVRAAGNKELRGDPWETTVDGMTAQMLLCDQISRNLFRGTKEAFAYDKPALENARALAQRVLAKDASCPAVDLTGEIYPPHLSFIVVAFMHSESVADHERGMKLLDYANANANTPEHLTGWWKGTRQFELDHKNVVDQFGRYPHRNAAKGRTSTPEELEWLADTDNLPIWAKSQM
jgi:uncharacterized protein (DUF924 family)